MLGKPSGPTSVTSIRQAKCLNHMQQGKAQEETASNRAIRCGSPLTLPIRPNVPCMPHNPGLSAMLLRSLVPVSFMVQGLSPIPTLITRSEGVLPTRLQLHRQLAPFLSALITSTCQPPQTAPRAATQCAMGCDCPPCSPPPQGPAYDPGKLPSKKQQEALLTISSSA